MSIFTFSPQHARCRAVWYLVGAQGIFGRQFLKKGAWSTEGSRPSPPTNQTKPTQLSPCAARPCVWTVWSGESDLHVIALPSLRALSPLPFPHSLWMPRECVSARNSVHVSAVTESMSLIRITGGLWLCPGVTALRQGCPSFSGSSLSVKLLVADPHPKPQIPLLLVFH